MKLLMFLIFPYTTIKEITLKKTKYKELMIIYTIIYTVAILLLLFWGLNIITIPHKPILIA